MKNPLVSIVCLCHNQASFVQEALESVWAQAYPEVELIVVDDGSKDGSVELIRKLLADRPEVAFLEIPESIGNCRAFNRGLKRCTGKYVIDLAADDVLLPQRVKVGVKALERAGEEFAVHFTDALYVDVKGKVLRGHYKRNGKGALLEKVPQGWVYEQVVQRYFICTPSMMMRKAVLDALGGYDEILAYEDFDFWVRSARHWQYCFTDEILVKKRIVPGSWSARQYEKESRQLESTLAVCRKARNLNKTRAENEALAKRLRYEIRQAIHKGNWKLAGDLFNLKKEVQPSVLDSFISGIFSIHVINKV